MGSVVARLALPFLAACAAACGDLMTESLGSRYPLLVFARGGSRPSPESYIPGGVPDPLFGSGGALVVDGAGGDGTAGGNDLLGDMMIDGRGRILLTGMSEDAGGNRRMALMRLLPRGTPDETFGAGGTKLGSAAGGDRACGLALAEDRAGRIVVGGTVTLEGMAYPAVWRVLGEGRADDRFGRGGVALLGAGEARESGAPWRCSDVAVDGRGGIVGVGVFGVEERDVTALFRLDEDGSPDESFGYRGFAVLGEAGGGDAGAGDPEVLHPVGIPLAMDGRGRIVVAGTLREGDAYDIAVWRFTPRGVPDDAFGRKGRSIIDLTTDTAEGKSNDIAFALALDGEGTPHIAALRWRSGYLLEMALARLTTAGTGDASFAGKGFLIVPGGLFEIPSSLALDRGGGIILSGASQTLQGDLATIIWRYHRDGRPDIAFGSDGRILISGSSGGISDMVNVDSMLFGTRTIITHTGGIVLAGSTRNPGSGHDLVMRKYQ